MIYPSYELHKQSRDTEDRRGKYPSPICFFVTYQLIYECSIRESPYFDFQACFHETGHAMHSSSIDPKNDYWDKYRIPMSVAKIFSIFLERLTKNADYISPLIDRLNNNNRDNIITKLTSKNQFIELFFVTF